MELELTVVSRMVLRTRVLVDGIDYLRLANVRQRISGKVGRRDWGMVGVHDNERMTKKVRRKI